MHVSTFTGEALASYGSGAGARGAINNVGRGKGGSRRTAGAMRKDKRITGGRGGGAEIQGLRKTVRTGKATQKQISDLHLALNKLANKRNGF